MHGYYRISLADVAAIQALPAEWVWAWIDGEKRRHEAEMRYRAELLAAVMNVGGIPVNPHDLYPEPADFDEKIRRLIQND